VAVKALFYCMVLFVGMILFLIVKEPYTLKAVNADGEIIPDIELFNAQNYQLKESGVESIVSSKRLARFGDVDKLYMVEASHKNKEGLHSTLSSNEAILKDKVIDFLTNSHFRRDDGIGLDGEFIRYDTIKGILSSEKPFIFLQNQSRTTGMSFVYQMKEGILNAHAIHAYIETEKMTGKKK
jgi:LPS export ABC transporter protein LptC